MDKSSKQPGRRSLLPQKSTKSQSLSTSKIAGQQVGIGPAQSQSRGQEARNDVCPIPPSLAFSPLRSRLSEIMDEDVQEPKPVKEVRKIQPPANIGRSISLKGRNERSHERLATQRFSSVRRENDRLTNASPTTIPRTTVEDASGVIVEVRGSALPMASGPSSTSGVFSSEDTIATNRSSRSTTGKREQNRKTSTTRPNIAISRHARSSSQQIPSKPPSNTNPPPSAEPAPEPIASKIQKPAFTALQQLFTNRKAPKATTASILHPPSSKLASDDVLSPEMAHLQLELLQLHMLHRSSASVQAQWEQSAKEHFKRELQDLSLQQAEFEKRERQAQAAINYPALVEWSQSTNQAEFTERIQILSRNLHGVRDLLDVESKYQRVIDLFERWFANASRLRGSRITSKHDDEQGLEFIEDIGDGWRAEVTYLERKLNTSFREIQELGQPKEASSVAELVSLLKQAVASMLEELECVQIMERDLVTLEAKWVEEEAMRAAW